MEDIVDEAEQDKNAVKNAVGSSASRFRKYKHVLPSGRILKILVDDESELIGSVAQA